VYEKALGKIFGSEQKESESICKKMHNRRASQCLFFITYHYVYQMRMSLSWHIARVERMRKTIDNLVRRYGENRPFGELRLKGRTLE
jgi:hypothetical protein